MYKHFRTSLTGGIRMGQLVRMGQIVLTLAMVGAVALLLWAISPWSLLGAAIVYFGVGAFALSSRAPDWFRRWFTGD